MLAWTLKASAANGASTGAQAAVVGGAGEGRRGEVADHVQQQPDAEVPGRRAEQQRDAARRARNASGSNWLPTSSTSASSSSATAHAASSSPPAWLRAAMICSGAIPAPPVTRVEAVEGPVAPVDDAAEGAGDADRPRQRRERAARASRSRWSSISSGSMPGRSYLLTNAMQRDSARACDLEELLGLRLHAASGVDQDHGAVDRGQHAQRVLGEVLMPGRVEQVEDDVVVLEAQHGGGDRDAAALLELHPVRGWPRAGLGGP